MFRGTRVPVSTLFENLRDGATIEQFLEWFPGVEGWKAEAVLERSRLHSRGQATLAATAHLTDPCGGSVEVSGKGKI